MVVCTLMFIIGGALQTEACRFLTNHYENGTTLIDNILSEMADTVITIPNKQYPMDKSYTWPRSLDLSTITYTNDHETLLTLFRHGIFDAVLTKCNSEPLIDSFNIKLLNFESIDKVPIYDAIWVKPTDL
ncbi:unnamed protein product [Protopolystoma xenopodis]|uniref:Uncharacterized protein n=1 Tax=Protopolystoma xenopodis TaxID=117903 RepID=A0A448WB89_9PLAT|nr:unnamed protein product [Protopolystoma xenopodis]